MDWLNSPVGGTEQLHGRIGRLGPYGPVLLDGPFETNLESTWGDEKEINGASSTGPVFIELDTGELRIAYQRNSDSYLVERIWDGISWGSESVISNNGSGFSADASYIQLDTGELRIAYRRSTDSYLVERVYNFGASSWGAENVINENNSYAPSYIQLKKGELRIAYNSRLAGIKNYLVERVYNFGASSWGDEMVINSTKGLYPSYIETRNEVLRISYYNVDDHSLVERIYNFGTSTWGSEVVITDSADVRNPSYMQTQLEELRIVYNNYATGDIVEKVYDFGTSTWGSEVVITDVSAYNISYIQLELGDIRLAYIKASDQTLVEITLQRYARLGAGVIESGHNANGYYQLESDGTLRMWVFIAAPVAATNTALDMPYTPYGPGGGCVSMSYVPVSSHATNYQAWINAYTWWYYIETTQPIYLTFVGRWRA
jgi:hypothetical protein